MHFLRQINWIDIFVIILLFRICSIAAKTGFPIELFKIAGTICAIYLGCHYYVVLSNLINRRLSWSGETLAFLDFIVFLILVLLGYFIFVLIRNAFTFLIRMEAVSLLNRWGSLVLALVRWALLASLLLFILTIPKISYLKNSLRGSFLRPKLSKLTPAIYSSIWNKLMFRFMNRESLNKEVFKIEDNLLKK